MLVLSRKIGEQIRIGEDVTITVLRSHGGRVRIGVDAPREVNILRTELIKTNDLEREALVGLERFEQAEVRKRKGAKAPGRKEGSS